MQVILIDEDNKSGHPFKWQNTGITADLVVRNVKWNQESQY